MIASPRLSDRSHTSKLNPNPKSSSMRQNGGSGTKKKKEREEEEKKSEFEFCKVCKLNHDQGLRHKYFPKHKSSLSAFLSRFQAKIGDIRFFLKNPSILRPEHASGNRFWCVFCDTDIDELGSSFACENAINHLASAHHLKKLKHFLWQYGGGMDRLDTFRVVEADLAKWEKKCKSLETEAAAASEGSHATQYGPSNDIHHKLKFENMNNLEQNTANPLISNHSNGVMPLQYHTNEYQVSYSGLHEATEIGSYPHDVTFSFPLDTRSGPVLWNSNGLTVNSSRQQSLLYNNGLCSSKDTLSNLEVNRVHEDGSVVHGERAHQGLQAITQVVSISTEQTGANVHSGAPPPWLETNDETLLDGQVKQSFTSFVSPSCKSGKSRKLNPKRVGAAWAEKRKMELEKEKRGEIIGSDYDANWLPNFGRVWQSGSRKESRKEFEIEKQKLLKVESYSEVPVKIQPYISKRMRKDAGEL